MRRRYTLFASYHPGWGQIAHKAVLNRSIYTPYPLHITFTGFGPTRAAAISEAVRKMRLARSLGNLPTVNPCQGARIGHSAACGCMTCVNAAHSWLQTRDAYRVSLHAAWLYNERVSRHNRFVGYRWPQHRVAGTDWPSNVPALTWAGW